MTNLQIQTIQLTDIRTYKNNPKLHNRAQVAKIRESIRQFGFINPVLLDENLEIIAGHGRLAAAQDMGMRDVPAIILSHLTDAQKRAYRIADNKLTELGKWSIELLNLEFSELSNLNLDFNLEITGFETAEIDLILDGDGASDPKADVVPALTDEDHRCHRGDIWKLGRHTIVCGDALMAESYAAIMGDERAQMVLTDAPYNVKVKSIGSMGKIKHDEFAMASGEMTPAEFTRFLTTFMRHAKEYSVNGALHYLFMGWKHVGEISTACTGSQYLNLTPHVHNHSIYLSYVKNCEMILCDMDKTLIARHPRDLVYASQTHQRSRPTNHCIFGNPPKTFRNPCKCYLFALHIPATV